MERKGAGRAKSQIYIETLVVSYLTSRIARDVVTSENQLATRDFWQDAPNRVDLVVSELVIQEASAGDPTAVRDRLAAIASLRILAADKESAELTRSLIQGHAMTPHAKSDAMHVAIAVANGVDYLVTWNLRNIANPRLIPLIDKTCLSRGYAPVMIRTPNQLRRFTMQDTERDPIMAELREIRARMAAEAGGNDIRLIFEYVRSKRKSPTTDSRGFPLSLRRKDASKSDEHSKE